MGLREIAESDLAIILEDSIYGFGFDIIVTDPDGLVVPMIGFSNDIGQAIDTETGIMVSGRTVSVALRLSTLAAKGLGIPQGIEDLALKPWRIDFDDINGNPFKFKVKKSMPDRALGIVVLILEFWED